MKKNAVILLILLTFVFAGFAVYNSFKKFNRYSNPNGPRPELVIYTHSSFMGVYGPGPELKKRFEKICKCDVRFEDVGSGSLLLQRLQLNSKKQVDLVLGLDQLSLKSAVQNIVWKQIKLPKGDYLPIFNNNKYETFIAYNWSPMSFIVRGPRVMLSQSLDEFLANLPEKSLTFPNPASSTPGLLLAFWLYDLSDRDNQKFKETLSVLKKKLKLQAAGWSGSYGLFTKGQAEATWSFQTSLLYHQQQGEEDYMAVDFTEARPVHLDFLGVPNTCMSCAFAQRFISFLLEPDQQKLLVQKNYMKSVLNQKFSDDNLPDLPLHQFKDLDELVDKKDEIIRLWNDSLL